MKTRHIQTVSQRLTLEIGYIGDIGPAGLTEAITEALKKGGVLEEGGIIYLRADAPGETLAAVSIWAPEPEPAGAELEIPTAEEDKDRPEPNL